MRVKCYTAVFLLSIFLVGFTAGCKKKTVVAPPIPPPPAATAAAKPNVPAATLIAEPSMVEAGQPVRLTWSSTDATAAVISGLGSVEVNGKQEVRPASSTTYELIVRGPGGSATASATVMVMAPPPMVPPAATPEPTKTLDERLAADLSDLYFDYDRNDLRDDARAVAAKNAKALQAILADFPAAVILLEGHCDERGSAEYNIGLGDRRAAAAREYLEALDVPADRLKTVSYGKERPQCGESTEACRQKNRRVHFVNGGLRTGTN